MKLALALAITIITLCQLATMVLAYDTWQMDKQFFDEMKGSDQPTEEGSEEKEIDRYA